MSIANWACVLASGVAMAGAGLRRPTTALRCTRLADLVNAIAPKLVAAAFGMRPEGVMFTSLTMSMSHGLLRPGPPGAGQMTPKIPL